MAEWFEEWFNTEEYLNVYRHRNDAEAEQLVNLILANIDLEQNADVIDLACGTGRHSILFAERGFNVTAVDLSEKLLSVARLNAESLGLQINFVTADLRNFCITSKFELAVNLFTSFGYFESDVENFSLFNDAFDLLKDDGYFVIDYFNANYIRKNLIPHSEDIINGKKIIQDRKILGDRVIKDIVVAKNGTRRNYRESVRMYSDSELKAGLEKSGLRIIKTFGDFKGSRFDLNSSSRIIIISSK
ncbi:MAG TPA: class I SAM-dependent methyltransferase [Ignavibacteriaceae bacterium]|nr:class I SAM-dependent methyltransferase [Ignavibacteriaceae bacterium]